MIKSIVLVTSILCLGLAGAGSYSPVSAAFGAFGGVCNRSDAAASSTCETQKNTNGEDPISGENGLLSKVADIVASVAGACAVIVILFGGFKFITSIGDAGATKNARNMILGAVIGIAVIVLARTLIHFVLSKL